MGVRWGLRAQRKGRFRGNEAGTRERGGGGRERKTERHQAEDWDRQVLAAAGADAELAVGAHPPRVEQPVRRQRQRVPLAARHRRHGRHLPLHRAGRGARRGVAEAQLAVVVEAAGPHAPVARQQQRVRVAGRRGGRRRRARQWRRRPAIGAVAQAELVVGA